MVLHRRKRVRHIRKQSRVVMVHTAEAAVHGFGRVYHRASKRMANTLVAKADAKHGGLNSRMALLQSPKSCSLSGRPGPGDMITQSKSRRTRFSHPMLSF